MAQLSRDRAPHLSARALAAAGVLLASLALASPALAWSTDALVGTWHVLIHYRDDNANDKQAMRWDDRVWVFERNGSGLRWTEYAIVVFRDQSGRFEKLGTSHQSRVVHAWQPNEDQLAQIERGLEVNERGKKSKTLRGSDATGWRSQAKPQVASATIVSYVENWSLADAGGLPVFQREDVLGSPTTESLEGITRFTTSAVEADGHVLRGTFERDGTRHGTFRMLRAGAVSNVKGTSEKERAKERGNSLEELLR